MYDSLHKTLRDDVLGPGRYFLGVAAVPLVFDTRTSKPDPDPNPNLKPNPDPGPEPNLNPNPEPEPEPEPEPDPNPNPIPNPNPNQVDNPEQYTGYSAAAGASRVWDEWHRYTSQYSD